MSIANMRAGHIIYAVDDLEEAMAEWRRKGFDIQYARKSKKVNALIYFSEGPFIELIAVSTLPKLALKAFSLFGAKGMVDRIKLSETVDRDSAMLCIEKDEDDLDDEVALLGRHGKKGNYLKRNTRKDPQGRVLKWKLFLPFDLKLPFLMSYYNIDPKPTNFVHPNGATRIKKLRLVTNREAIDLLEKLIGDETIELVEGDKIAEVVDVEYDYANSQT